MDEMRQWQLQTGSSDDDAVTVVKYWETQPRGKPDLNILWWARKNCRELISESFAANIIHFDSSLRYRTGSS